MTYSNLTKLALSSALMLGLALPAAAQQTDDVIETAKPIKTAQFDAPEGRAARLNGTIQSRPVALIFTSFDSNADYAISRSELDAGLSREWSNLETNFSGKASPISFEKWQVKALGSKEALPSRVTFDKDYDSMVSKAEFSQTLVKIFTDMDKDDDGALSRAELTFAAPRRVSTRERPRERRERQQQQLPRRF